MAFDQYGGVLLDEDESRDSFGGILIEESEPEQIPPPQRPITGATGTWEEAGDKPDWAAIEAEYNRRTYGPPSEPDLTLGQTIKQGLSEGMATAAESPIGLPAKAMSFVPRPTAQETQDVFDLITNPLNPGAPSRPPSEAAQALTGAVNVGRDVGEGLASPIGVATLGMGAAPQAIRRLGEAAFAADMLSQVPEQAQRAGEASVTGDTQERVEAFGGLGVTGVFAAGMGTAALRPTRPPELPRQTVAALERGAEAGLSKSVAAAADAVVKEPPKPEVASAVKEPIPETPAVPPPAQEVIRSVVEMSDAEAGNLKQRPAVEAGMKLTPEDVPALEQARDVAGAEMMKALESGDEAKFKAEYGKNIWFSGAIEGANKKGPNFDAYLSERAKIPTEGGEIRKLGVIEPAPEPIKAVEPVGAEPALESTPPISETIKAAAIRAEDGTIYTGKWHPAAYEELMRSKGPTKEQAIRQQQEGKVTDGFLTSSGRFVGREEAAAIASKGSQFRPGKEGDIAFAGGLKGMEAGPGKIAPKTKKTSVDMAREAARKPATPDTIETTPLDPQSGASIAPPAKPPAPPAPPTVGAPAAPTPPPPGRGPVTLDDVYQRFEPAPKERKSVKQVAGETVEAFRTGFSSKFRPLNKLAEDVAKSVGAKAKDAAGIFEQLKGSSGKAEADVYRFDKDVSDTVKGSEKDFNAYMFLRRSLDRLKQDATDIDSAIAGQPVAKLNRRAVSQYTIPQLESKLAALSEQIGGEKLTKFNEAADAYQGHMDQALKLQVESGRMSPEVYDAIKAGNQFYAPFKVMKYIEETMRPDGTGRRVDTLAEFTKAMEGIEDPNFKLGDMLSAARQNLTMSRVLAEKNRAMQNITELAALDVDGNFVQKLKPGQDAPRGMEAVNVMENGVKERYAVNEDVAQAVQNVGPGLPAGIVARWASTVFRAGATTLNVAFQPVNLLFADAPRAALVSKYGVKGVTDLVRYPMDFVESLFSSIVADMGGYKNKLFQDYLDSGAAGTTIQQYLTPEALRFKADTTTSKTKAIAHTILNTVPQFANAIEQTSKVLGVKRAMRLEGVESGAALAKQIPEAITEIRRFSGSPDFGRSGKWTDQYRLNMIYMFLNARIQGAVADVGRLTGRDGANTAANTWLKMGTAVGLPTAYLYMLNNSEEYKKDYDQRPEQEKQNYWLIPKDTFITGSNGEKIRDYWRVPKREIAQWMGNAVESGLDFANQRDPEAFWKWAEGMAESIAPVNIRGKTLQERGESVLSGTHPFIKAPIETFAGRDLYRHRNIVPDSQKKASPEQQYDDRTPDVFKALADKMPDVAPEVFRSPKMLENMTRNFTAGLITQFLPRKPVEGRTPTENNPLLQRFQALPYTDSTEFEERISKFERESADEQLTRLRTAQQILKDHPGAKPDVLIRDVAQKHGADRKLAERVIDLYQAEQRGITPQERRVLALPVAQRADYLAGEMEGKTPEQKAALIRNWALKRLLTEQVVRELGERIR